MNVLLINAKYSEGNAPSWIPIGLLSIASYLRTRSIKVKVIDNEFSNMGTEDLKREVMRFKPDIVGISAMTVQVGDAIKIGRIIKEIDRGIRLVYGGVHFTFMPEDGLKYGNVVVLYAGEESMLEICLGKDLSDIKGICYKWGDEIVRTEKRDFIQNLDHFPIPAYDLINFENYNDKFVTGEKAISIMTGRGCPYNCIFCASPQFYGRRVGYHSIGYVMEHINFLRKTFALKNLRIMDDTFTLSKKRVLIFCDEVKKLPYTLNITCLTNVKNADYEMFKRMKEVGFSIVAFGVESGNDEVLKRISKNVTKDQVRNAVSWAKKAGLETELLFMIGNITETEKSIEDSIEFAKELKTRYCWFQYAIPFPGSKFYEMASRFGKVVTDDFGRYHHQRPVFIPFGLSEEIMEGKRLKALATTRNFSIKERIKRKIRHVLS